MNIDYARGAIHALLVVAVVTSLATAALGYAGLMTLAAVTIIGGVTLASWSAALLLWAISQFWG